jgi:hypothetical protein
VTETPFNYGSAFDFTTSFHSFLDNYDSWSETNPSSSSSSIDASRVHHEKTRDDLVYEIPDWLECQDTSSVQVPTWTDTSECDVVAEDLLTYEEVKEASVVGTPEQGLFTSGLQNSSNHEILLEIDDGGEKEVKSLH